MVTRKTQVGWMALGATLCLFGAVLVVKMRDSNRVAAQVLETSGNLSAGAAAGTLTKVLEPKVEYRQLPSSDAQAPKTLASALFEDAKAIPLPEKKETAEPPIFPAVAFQPKVPAKFPGSGPELPPAIALTEPPVGPVLTPPTVPEPNLLTPPPVVVPVRFDNLAPPPAPMPPAPGPLPSPLKRTSVPASGLADVDIPPPAASSSAPIKLVRNLSDTVQPLPNLRARPTPSKAKLMPLTGTYVGSLDDHKGLALLTLLRDQLAGDGRIMISPGSDVCLWITTPGHLERLTERLEQSRAREADVRAFRRLYFAQAETASMNGDGHVAIPERLAQFAGLDKEVVLVGIDDHIEVWDAVRWKRYTQEKSASARSTADQD